MALISFHKYSLPRNKLEQRICVELNAGLEGDWLNSAPDLDAGENRCHYALETCRGSNDKLKYSNSLQVVREKDSVYIIRIGVLTDKKEKLCGYELINDSNSLYMAKAKKTLGDLISDLTEKSELKQVINVPLNNVYPSDTNPRKSMNEESIIDLAESMKDVGLLQPITIRPDANGKFEIVAGHRRFKAAQLLKWESIPSIIREVGDEEMLEIQIIENLQREEVNPMDEAAAFQTILNRESIDWLCARIHKSKKYVSDRLKLNELIEAGRGNVHASVLPITHAIMISKLPADEQKKCIDKCIENNWATDRLLCTMTIGKLREFIENELMIDLDRACFDLEDVELVPDAGSCAACTKRTCNQNLLFQEITEEDKCTDAACYHAKEQAHVATTLKKAKEEHGKESVFSGQTDGYSTNTIKVKGVSVSFSEKKAKGKGKDQVCVVVTKTSGFNLNKSKLGKKVWVNREDIDGKVQQKEERKANGGNVHSSWEEKRKNEFSEIVHPRLLKIGELLNTGSIANSETITLNYIRARFEYENERDVIALASVLGLFDIEEQMLWQANDDIDWEVKMGVIDKLITYIQSKGIPTATILALIYAIDDSNDVRTAEEMIQEECVALNWNELMEIIDGKKTKPAKKSAKKAATK